LAYQAPASSTFLSEQTSHQQPVLFSQNKSASVISHQPNERAVNVDEIPTETGLTACCHVLPLLPQDSVFHVKYVICLAGTHLLSGQISPSHNSCLFYKRGDLQFK
jgi:hypothetical protein